MGDEKIRIAKTESLFRDVNERIAESVQGFDSEEAMLVCECADTACTERVAVALDDYEEVRSDGTQFVLAHGHEDADVERVVEKRQRYQVVQKVHDVVALWARRLDPRAGSA
jgi:hypothetical protein